MEHSLTLHCCFSIFFFFNDTATTEIYTLSLHDALPISSSSAPTPAMSCRARCTNALRYRSEEHTSELQSRGNLVCRLLLEKKKQYSPTTHHSSANFSSIKRMHMVSQH